MKPKEISAIIKLAHSAPQRNMDQSEAYGMLLRKLEGYFSEVFRKQDEARDGTDQLREANRA